MNRLAPLRQYLPILGMVLVVVLQAVYTAFNDSKLSPVELLNIMLALAGAITVYVVPKLAGLIWLKPLVAAVTAALMVFLDAFSKEPFAVSPQTWIMAAIQFLVGLGIVAYGNRDVPLTSTPARAA